MKDSLLIIIVLFILNTINCQNEIEINICKDKTKEDFIISINLLKQKIQTDSMDLNLRYDLGMSYYKLVDSLLYIKSIEQWDFIIRIDSCYNYAYYNRGLCKFFLKNKKGFCEDLEKSLECHYPDMSHVENFYKQYCSFKNE